MPVYNGNTVTSGYEDLGRTQLPNAVNPLSLPNFATVTQAAAGSRHACFYGSDNTVRCIGANYNGQLGRANSASTPNAISFGTATVALGLSGSKSVLKLAAGYDFTCALLTGGELR